MLVRKGVVSCVDVPAAGIISCGKVLCAAAMKASGLVEAELSVVHIG
jgi:hypothetical protein